MTGGELFVHDPHRRVPIRLNPELVEAKAASVEALERLHLSGAAAITSSRDRRARLRSSAEWDATPAEMLHIRPRLDLATIVGVQEGTRVDRRSGCATSSARPLRSVRTS